MQGGNIERARRLRLNSTSAERLLWLHIRNRKVMGVKFRRQHPCGPYFLDFYCAERKLCVEIDGGGHDEPDQRDHDERRSQFLAAQGVRTIRFWNSQIRENLDGVIERIRMELSENPSS